MTMSRQRLARMQRRAARASIREYAKQNASTMRDDIIAKMAAVRTAHRWKRGLQAAALLVGCGLLVVVYRLVVR